jgi:aspartyl-tRNA(Asn)/glutamyl-tRNA(Gln) amidotransferase subunit B
MIDRITDGTISGKIAKEKVFPDLWHGKNVGLGKADLPRLTAYFEGEGVRQISDAGAIEKLVDEVLAKNARQVADYRAGKEKAFNSLVGQVMKASQGKANPAQVNELLRQKLKS